MLGKIFISIVFYGLIYNAYAGGTSGGGGGAFVCRDVQGRMINSELLDLWEAEKIKKLKVVRSNDPINVQIQRALSKFPDYYILVEPNYATFLENIKAEVKEIISNAKALDENDDITLPPPRDSNTNYQKRGCPLEGMMFFDGDLNHVVYHEETYNKLLSNTDKAAIWVHEAIYKVMREKYSSTDSINTRKMVGCLFSSDCKFDLGLTIDQLLANDPNTIVIKCNSKVANEYEYYYSAMDVTGDLWFQVKTYYTKLEGRSLVYPIVYRLVNPAHTLFNYYYQGGLKNYGVDIFYDSDYQFPYYKGNDSDICVRAR